MSHILASSTQIAPAILKALKVDLKYVKRIEIDLDVDSLPFCRIEFYPTLEQLEDVSQALETQMKQLCACRIRL
jgi:hypothetical protein